MTFCTSSTSEKPSRSELEMSKVPSVDAVSTPPVPRNLLTFIPFANVQSGLVRVLQCLLGLA